MPELFFRAVLLYTYTGRQVLQARVVLEGFILRYTGRQVLQTRIALEGCILRYTGSQVL